MPYNVEIAPAAERQIRKIEPTTRGRILKKIESLGTNPRPAGVEKLADSDFYRVRVGDYRIIYEVEDKMTSVLILKVGDRKDVYKRKL